MNDAEFIFGFQHLCESRCVMHTHAYYELVYHVSGRGMTMLETGNEYSFQQDSIVIYKADIAHNQTMFTDGIDACVHFRLKSEETDSISENGFLIERLEDDYLRNEILRLADTGNTSILTTRKRHSLNLRLSALLNDIISVDSEETPDEITSIATTMNRAHSYISEHFRSLESIEEVARQMGFSYDYLRHQFKQTYGISLVQHLTNTKIDYAKQLLSYTPLPQKQIAEECGFSNIRYFNHVFKKATSMTPGRFRRMSTERR